MNLSGCNSRLIGNGFCNDETNNAEGSYDGGDCCGTNVNTEYCSDCKCYKVACAAGIVPHPMVGDGFCNDEANHLECNYDGGDCCGSCVVKLYCSDCQCLGGDAGNGVSSPSIGDGICHDENNVAECNYDGGDCCVLDANTEHCTECQCHHQLMCAAGISHPKVGDGFCNDGTNNPECNYDGGDCCGSCVVKQFCSYCQCLEGDNTGNGVSSPSIGDGVCHDDNNVADCNYDGGDCCSIGNNLIGNGFCNIETNNAECNYDGGDCCGPDVSCKYQLIRVKIKRK